MGKKVGTTVTRAVDVLDMFAAAHPDGLTAATIASRTDMSRASTYRLLLTLQARNLVRAVGNREYKMGLGVLAWSQALLGGGDVVDAIRPVLERVSARTGETTYLGVLNGSNVLYVARVDSPQPVHMRSSVGQSNPLHSTALGKSLLAFSPAVLEEYCRAGHLEARTERTITSTADLIDEIERVRAKGVAMDNEENEHGIRCVAAAVVMADRTVGAISVSAPAFRTPMSKLEGFGELLRREITRATSSMRDDQ